MNENKDIYKPWHDYLQTIRNGEKSGELKFNKQVSDIDIATTFVIGIAYEHGYETLTIDQICNLLSAFTDVWDKEGDI